MAVFCKRGRAYLRYHREDLLLSTASPSPLLEYLLLILGTTASAELTTFEINSENVLSFLVPAYSSIFCSIKAPHLETPGMMSEPVDVLIWDSLKPCSKIDMEFKGLLAA